jgi:hypothetical protein
LPTLDVDFFYQPAPATYTNSVAALQSKILTATDADLIEFV